jgi:hypothetical protein
MRIVTWRFDEPSADWILEQIPDDLAGRLILSQDVIVIAALPQPIAGPLLPFEGCSLLEQPDPLLKVAPVFFRLADCVQMIRHETVRNY